MCQSRNATATPQYIILTVEIAQIRAVPADKLPKSVQAVGGSPNRALEMFPNIFGDAARDAFHREQPV
jgi:hypothetical protein